MKPLVSIMALVAVAVTVIISSARRTPPPDPVARGLQKGGAWSAEFSGLYPKPPGKTKPPVLGRTGDIGNTSAFEFFLLSFPKTELPGLETWLRGKMNEDAIAKVVLHGTFPVENQPDENLVRAETIVLHADGRREVLQGATPAPVSLNGRPILRESNP